MSGDETARKPGDDPLVEALLRRVAELETRVADSERMRLELETIKERYRLVSGLTSHYAYSLTIGPDDVITTEWVIGDYERITGVSSEVVRPHKVGEIGLVHPDDSEIMKDRVARLRAGEDVVSEYRILRRDGGMRWLRAYGRRVYHSEETGLMRIVGAVRDISADKAAELSLRAREEELRRLVDNIPIGVYRSTPDGRTLFANPALLRMLGYESFEALAAVDINVENRLEIPRSTWMAMVDKTGRLMGHEARWRRSDGAWIHVRESTQAVRDDRGNVLFYEGTVEDISREAEHQARIQEQEEQLRRTRKLESLGLLAGGIAHDFNNLLVSILGNAGLARMQAPASAGALHETIEAIEGTALHASELCKMLLAYGGRGRFVRQPLDLNELAGDLLSIMSVAMPPDIVVETNFCSRQALVEGDPGQLRQVVMNLLKNAADAMPEGGILQVFTRVGPVPAEAFAASYTEAPHESGSYVTLVVRDSGRGMDEGTMARIFEPFFTTKDSGRGLGLAAVLGILRGHDAAIRVESAPGAGATFTVHIPSAAASQTLAVTSSPSAGEPVPELAGTALVIDDEPLVRNLCASLLGRAGMRVLQAADGAEGIQTFRLNADDITVVLCDLKMPGLMGDEVLDEIRRIRPGARLLLMTGYVDPSATDVGRLRRFDGLLEKPFRAQSCLAVVASALATPREG